MIRFLQLGNWLPSDVSLEWTPNRRRLEPAVETAIDTAWSVAIARPGVHLFDGPMCRVESWEDVDGRLKLSVSRSTYKQFVGTNMSHPEFAEQFGTDVMANPLGVSPALLTVDRQLLLGHRSDKVAYYPGRLHPFAGCMEPSDQSVFAAVLRELKEELSLSPGEILNLRCTGIAEDTDLRQAEMIFAALTVRTKQEIAARLDPVEHRSLWAIPATADAIAQAVTSDRRLTPVAIAALLLWGRLEFGDPWFKDVAARQAS